MTKLGPGTLTLTGTSTYTGATKVNGGTLAVNGSIAGSALLTVNGGGTLGGTGTVGATNINGGTLAPGNSVGTITVQGNLTFGAGATYAVEVSGTADRTNVTGTAALAGTVAPIAAGAATPGTYTILSAAGGRTGAFTALDETRIPAFNASLGYTATDVLLTLTSGIAQVPGLNPAQSGIGTILDGYINSGAALSPGLITLLNLSQPALSGALTQLSGQAATGATPAATQLMSSFLSLLLNPFTDGRGGFGPATGYAPQSEPLPREIADAYAAAMPVKAQPAAFAQRWSVWGAAYGGVNKTDGNLVTGAQDLTARAYGFAAGADYRVAPDTRVGFALAGGGTNWHLPGGLGTGKSDAFQAGVYAIRQFGAAYVSGALAYAWHDVTTERTITFSGDHLKANFDANNFGGRIEGGTRFAAGAAGFTPYAALQAQSIRLPAYAETAFGSPLFALGYAGKSVTATRTELGSWFHTQFALRDGTIMALRGRAAWANDHSSDRTVNAAFQAIPGGSFTVTGAQRPDQPRAGHRRRGMALRQPRVDRGQVRRRVRKRRPHLQRDGVRTGCVVGGVRSGGCANDHVRDRRFEGWYSPHHFWSRERFCSACG